MPRTKKKKKESVSIRKDGQLGEIVWEYDNGGKVDFSVDFPDKTVMDDITKHLSTKREFFIPESKRIDDYRVDNELPTKNEMYFNLALCVLHTETGVWVIWK